MRTAIGLLSILTGMAALCGHGQPINPPGIDWQRSFGGNNDEIWLTVAALLAACLCLIVLRRHRREAERRRRVHAWEGRGLDASQISAPVRRLREDYLAAVRPRPDETDHKRRLLASARRTIVRFSYFRSAGTESLSSTENDARTEVVHLPRLEGP